MKIATELSLELQQARDELAAASQVTRLPPCGRWAGAGVRLWRARTGWRGRIPHHLRGPLL